MGARELLLTEIARCPLVQLNLEQERPSHPCHKVVTHQWRDVPADQREARSVRENHLPEPWIGHIEKAPLLFISSNPSLASFRKAERPKAKDFAPPVKRIGEHHVKDHSAFRHGLAAPKPDWDDAEIADRYVEAFDVWMVNGTSGVADTTGKAGASVPYWVAARRLAGDLFGGNVRPGTDYALTEVVHCKSRGEVGAREALSVCSSLYLRRVIALSPARLIVVYGEVARNAVRGVFDYKKAGRVSQPLRIAGRDRRLVFLSHPNARQTPPEYPKELPEGELREVRAWFGKTARS